MSVFFGSAAEQVIGTDCPPTYLSSELCRFFQISPSLWQPLNSGIFKVMTITFRKLKIEDCQIYVSLRLECLKNFPDNFGSSYDEEAETLSAKFQKFAANPANAFLLGAFDGENLVGILGFERPERRKTRHRGEIVQMYVSPNYAGHKIGTSLLRKTVEIAFEIEGIEQLELGVVSNNVPAIKLYEKFGFKSYGIQRNYFRGGGEYRHQQFMQLFKDEYKINLEEI